MESSPILFTFGPDQSFFFYCPVKSIFYRTNSAFTKTVPPNLRVPYSVCLGPADNEYVAFYENKDGRQHYSMNILTTASLLPIVNFFLRTFRGDDGPQSIRGSSFVLGPADSFVAIAPSTAQTNVATLEPLLRVSSGSPVVRASLGCGGAWWVQYADATCRWDFGGGFADLNALMLQEVDTQSIKYLALSPFSNRHYFLVYDRDSKVRYSLPELFAETIGPVVDEYHAWLGTTKGTHIPAATLMDKEAHEGNDAPAPPPYSKASSR